jgi:hypothetical protein
MEPKLDAATLREVLAAVTRFRDTIAALPTSKRAAQRGMVAACNDIADDLHKNIAEAEEAPPATSDWVRACETSDMGEPEVNDLDLGFGDGIRVRPARDCGGSMRGVWEIYIPNTVGSDVIWIATPAELTAALNLLAAERKAKP